MPFEQPILSTDPLIPGPVSRTPVTLSSADLAMVSGSYTSGTPLGGGLIDVREWPILDVVLQATVSSAQIDVSIEWYGNAAGTQLLAGVSFRTMFGRRITDSVVNQGPYVRITPTFAGGPVDLLFFARGRTPPLVCGQGSFAFPGNDSQELAFAEGALGAGASIDAIFNFVQRGRATLVLNCDGQTCFALVRPLDASGAFVTRWVAMLRSSSDPWSFQQMFTFSVPGTLCRLTILNADGAAHFVSSRVTLEPTP